MFLQRDGHVVRIPISEAQRWGYSLTVSPQRVVLRSPNAQPHAEVMMVGNVLVVHSVYHRFMLSLVISRSDSWLLHDGCGLDSLTFRASDLSTT